MDMRMPPLKIKILLESNPLKSRILVRSLGVVSARPGKQQIGKLNKVIKRTYKKTQQETIDELKMKSLKENKAKKPKESSPQGRARPRGARGRLGGARNNDKAVIVIVVVVVA